MQSNRKRIRKIFAPLTVATSIRCVSSGSPATQVFNGKLAEYEPDRTLTPTIIQPEVVAHATDGSWPDPYSNSKLADMHWFVNGKDIATLPDWAGLYSIDQTGDTRGAITISRNISPTEVAELHFEANLADTRLGVNIPIVTDKITLSTTEKTDSSYAVSVSDGGIIRYDPVKDMLRLYRYKVAHGLVTASAAQETAATDECAYLHTVPVHVFNGEDEISTGYTLKLYRVESIVNNSVNEVELTTADYNELVSITTTEIKLDLRLIEKASYRISVCVNGKEVASTELGVNRIYQSFRCMPTNGTAIHPDDTERYDKVMVDCDGNVVECPGSIYRITWYTDSDALMGVKHNEGEETVFQLADTGIGSSWNDDWLDVYVECEYKDKHKLATAGTAQLTDKNGIPYIFN